MGAAIEMVAMALIEEITVEAIEVEVVMVEVVMVVVAEAEAVTEVVKKVHRDSDTSLLDSEYKNLFVKVFS
jgi:hypothetical protein